ncbi:MAG: Hsp20/alpha crystallin family protein [Clostridiales bacterium]|nr:Hsp20/alpha crystallin family protein [Clostridiales bacterium]
MFDLIPFEQRSKGLFDPFEKMAQGFFGDWDKDIFPCRTDILDKGDKFVLKADMPGFNKEDIHIDINGDVLTLNAEHKEEVNEDKKDFVRRERRYGSVSRSFDISDVEADKITASYEKGVLELEMPKKQSTVPPTRQIEVK